MVNSATLYSLAQLKAHADSWISGNKNVFLEKAVSIYTSSAKESEIQKEFIEKILDLGAELRKSSFKKLHLSSQAIWLLIDHKDRLVNEDNAQTFFKEVMQHIFGKETVEQNTEETLLSIAQQYKVSIPSEVLLLPYKIFQKLTHLSQFHFDCATISEVMNFEDINVISKPNYIIDYKYRNLGLKPGHYTKIPSILHHIWLTSPDAPRQIMQQDIDNAIKTQDLFNKSTIHSWQQIIWVNDKSILQPSIETLKNTGIIVREYGELKQYLKNYDIIEEQIKLGHWGLASDTLRYDLVHYMGGLYADINYIFDTVPDQASNTYDFFSVTYSSDYLDNFFFAAKPNHPVITCTQDTVRKNIISPSYGMQKIYNSSVAAFTDKASADPIGNCYFKAAHQNDNIDVVFPKPPSECDLSPACSTHYKEDSIIESNAEENVLKFCPQLHNVAKGHIALTNGISLVVFDCTQLESESQELF